MLSIRKIPNPICTPTVPVSNDWPQRPNLVPQSVTLRAQEAVNTLVCSRP